MTKPETSCSKIEELLDFANSKTGIRLAIKRDDLIHPVIIGNKWRKLKYNIERAKQQKNRGILTFGGAFSNHLHATAYACKLNGLMSVGIVRGNELNPKSNQCLKAISTWGMKLDFVSREHYRLKDDKSYLAEINAKYSNYLIVPEGGANYHGVAGCAEIVDENFAAFDIICVSSGTGTTAAGIVSKLKQNQQLWVFAATGSETEHRERIKNLLNSAFWDEDFTHECLQRIGIFTQYQFGGFAKVNDELRKFYFTFIEKFGIELDLTYTAKMFFGLHDMITKEKIEKNKNIICIHTGGLQANASLI